MKAFFVISSIILSSLLLNSCDSKRQFEDYHDFKDAYWHKDSVQSFTFEIEDASMKYDILAQVRNTPQYPFYNLYYQYCLTDDNGDTIKNELKEVLLFHSKTGEPLGNGLGDLFDNSSLSHQGITFPNSGKYTATFRQMMRMDSLPFILSVGCRVEKQN